MGESMNPELKKILKYTGIVVGVAIAVVVIAIVILTPRVKSGTIVDKRFEPAHTETIWVSHETCTGTGTSRSCSSTSVPQYNFVADAWSLRLRNCEMSDDGECREGWVRVGEITYVDAELGEFYDSEK